MTMSVTFASRTTAASAADRFAGSVSGDGGQRRRDAEVAP